MTSETQNSVAPERQGRPKRAEVTTTERRRRVGGTTHKLAIPESIKQAHPGMEFRWGRDDGGRMDQLTKSDDWDHVPDVEPIHGGRGETGRSLKMHLLMKPVKFMEQDRAEKEARLVKIEKDQLVHPDAKTATESGAEMYSVPGNKI